MRPLLQFENVSRAFNTPVGLQAVLHDVDTCVYPGEFTAVTGPSGSGKSTFLNLCALLDEPSSGEIFFDGAPTSDVGECQLNVLRKYAVGMIFQQYCLLPYRSVLENVQFRFRYLDIARKTMQERSLEALRLVGLEHLQDRAANLLSGGEAQRVGIARAIALKPRLLVADEPTGNLDGRSADQVMTCLQDLGKRGDMAILLVTHDESLLRYASRQLRCEGGRLYEAA